MVSRRDLDREFSDVSSSVRGEGDAIMDCEDCIWS